MEFEVFSRQIEVVEGNVKNRYEGRKEVKGRQGELEEGLEEYKRGDSG